MMKECNKCHQILTLDQFHHDRRCEDGHRATCKTCVCAYNKERRKDPRILERERELRAESEDRYRTLKRLNYLANKDRRAELKKVREAENPELYAQARTRAWKRYDNRRRSLPHDFLKKDSVRLTEWWDGKCAYCGNPQQCQDHFIPLSDLSSDNPGTVPTNILPCCLFCNNSKGDLHAEVWLAREHGQEYAEQTLQRINSYFQWVRETRDYSKVRRRKLTQADPSVVRNTDGTVASINCKQCNGKMQQLRAVPPTSPQGKLILDAPAEYFEHGCPKCNTRALMYRDHKTVYFVGYDDPPLTRWQLTALGYSGGWKTQPFTS